MDGCDDDDDDASINRFLDGWLPSSFSRLSAAAAAVDVVDEDEDCCFRLPRGKAVGW